MAHRTVGHKRCISRVVRYRIGEISSPPNTSEHTSSAASPIANSAPVAHPAVVQSSHGFLALGRHYSGGFAVAWFIEQSALMIVLAFVLGLFVGWLYWGRLARA